MTDEEDDFVSIGLPGRPFICDEARPWTPGVKETMVLHPESYIAESTEVGETRVCPVCGMKWLDGNLIRSQ